MKEAIYDVVDKLLEDQNKLEITTLDSITNQEILLNFLSRYSLDTLNLKKFLVMSELFNKEDIDFLDKLYEEKLPKLKGLAYRYSISPY